MFKIILEDLGTMEVGKNYEIVFPYENISYIESIEVTCDCTEAKNDIINNRVSINYKPKPIPEHLKMEGKTEYIISKKAVITYYTKDTSERKSTDLVFSGVVKEKI